MGASRNANSRKSRSGISASSDVIFVGGIPRGATQCDLRNFFQEVVGDVKKVRFVIDRTTRSHRGFGFVRFRSEESVLKALVLKESGLVFRGKVLNVGCSGSTTTNVSDSGSSGSPPADEDDMSDLPELEDDMELMVNDVVSEETIESEETDMSFLAPPQPQAIHQPVAQPQVVTMQPTYTGFAPAFPQYIQPCYVIANALPQVPQQVMFQPHVF